MGYSDAGWLASHIDIVRHTQMYAIKHLACLSPSATINSGNIFDLIPLAHLHPMFFMFYRQFKLHYLQLSLGNM
jgi:hypothetical protein